ncbi:DUF2232 domain-containing protein [Hydrogenovibrio marinus]|uniref:DUF2232 domain-containing protein n=1 Tax=Hydrogenovibrio marinus TaxID=28885 RepID=A0A066ZX41_HYDMR|nr:DUF2232 domain-containing protein [Hydrogenovibrio marinus]KDN94926.1 hypothetical protein EI16_01020 [Hydrogenovibrio marinus]BBN59390.1 hypothetical protein HVMH_0984 [Hydrogenovibrio marinus]
MLFIANYVMKGQLPAYIATAILALLTVWFGPVGMLLGAVIALVTLRVGSGEGLKVLTAAVAINLVATQAFLGASLPAIVAIVEYMVPVWLMAWVLRSTNSLTSALSLGMLMTGAVVITFHMMVGDTTAWWSNMMNTALLPYVKEAGVEAPADVIATLSEVATMLLAMFMVVLWFSILLLGRWWQGRLYHPGQFQQDFYQIRLPKNLAYLAVVLAVAGLVFKSGIVQDLSGVMMAGLMFPGLAIAHHAVAVKKMGNGWLVGLYVLLFLFPQTILILATIGLIDTWLDIKSRWSQDS